MVRRRGAGVRRRGTAIVAAVALFGASGCAASGPATLERAGGTAVDTELIGTDRAVPLPGPIAPVVPSPVPSPTTAPEPTPAPSTTTTTTSTTTTLPPQPVAWPGERFEGFTLWGPQARHYEAPMATASLREITALGAGTIAVSPAWFQSGAHDDAIGRVAGRTVSDDDLRALLDRAEADGIRTVLKPHVDRLDDGWRGDIAPSDADAWFASYTAMLAHYAAIARDHGVDLFVVGTELHGTSTDTARWRGVVDAARREFAGPVTYGALSFEVDQIGFWDALDLVAVHAYWPLSDTATSDRSTLAAAWAPIIDELEGHSVRLQRPIMFTEAGYTSRSGSTTEPSSWSTSDRADESEQAAAYAALLDATAPHDWFAGVLWWNWKLDDDPTGLDFTPEAKLAADEVAARWSAG